MIQAGDEQNDGGDCSQPWMTHRRNARAIAGNTGSRKHGSVVSMNVTAIMRGAHVDTGSVREVAMGI